MSIPTHKELCFRRMQLALLAMGLNYVFLSLDASCDEVSAWLREYDIGKVPPKAGVALSIGRFHSRQALLTEELWTTVHGYRRDEQASEDWGEPINRMAPMGGIACKLERSPHGATYATIEWNGTVRQWAGDWLACLLADMDERWQGVAKQVIEQGTEAVAATKAAIAAEKVAVEPVPTTAGGNGGQHAPERCPTCPWRKTDFNRWVSIWQNVRRWADDGLTTSEIERKLNANKKVCSYDTLAKVIQEGKKGHLDYPIE